LSSILSNPPENTDDAPESELPTEDELRPIPQKYITEANSYFPTPEGTQIDVIDQRTNETGSVTATVTPNGIPIFDPQIIAVHPQMPVGWEVEQGEHTVTDLQSEDPAYDSGLLSTNDGFEYQYIDGGVHPYYCQIHEPGNMRGVVIVVE
jgi:plastocyanin